MKETISFPFNKTSVSGSLAPCMETGLFIDVKGEVMTGKEGGVVSNVMVIRIGELSLPDELTLFTRMALFPAARLNSPLQKEALSKGMTILSLIKTAVPGVFVPLSEKSG